jgi:hypothetical protein
LSRQCGILNISQPYKPPRPVKGIVLLFLLVGPNQTVQKRQAYIDNTSRHSCELSDAISSCVYYRNTLQEEFVKHARAVIEILAPRKMNMKRRQCYKLRVYKWKVNDQQATRTVGSHELGPVRASPEVNDQTVFHLHICMFWHTGHCYALLYV